MTGPGLVATSGVTIQGATGQVIDHTLEMNGNS
jgi:hypothetical protein